MKRVIFKYKLKEATVNKIKLPVVHHVLKAKVIGGEAFIWVEQEVDAELHEFEFYLEPTGMDFDKTERVYVDTIFPGPFVFHIYKKLL